MFTDVTVQIVILESTQNSWQFSSVFSRPYNGRAYATVLCLSSSV